MNTLQFASFYIYNKLYPINKIPLARVIVKYIKSLLIHPLNSSHTKLLKHIKHRQTDIDIAEENNIYWMLTQQWPVSN